MKRLLALFFLIGITITIHATAFISDLMVGTGSTEAAAKQALTSAGFTVIDRNVNRGTDGYYIYIGFKATTDKANAITDVLIANGSIASTVPVDGKRWTKASYNTDVSSAGNLNYGRSDVSNVIDALFLYYSKTGSTAAETPAVNGIYIESYTTEHTNENYAAMATGSGKKWTVTPSANMNAGGSATEYHYLKTAKHTCSITYTSTSTTHTKSCSECKYTYATNESHTHAWRTNPNISSECQEYCSECNYVFQNIKHDQNGYQYVNEIVHKQCCSRCGYYVTSYNHTLKYTDVSDEVHRVSCSICGWEADVNHQYTIINKKNDTAHNETCSLCGRTTAVEHDFSVIRQNSTLSNIAHSSYCSKCDAIGPSYPHTKVVDSAERPATCVAPGVTEAWHCTDCEYRVGTNMINALGHIPTINEAVEATCTTDGSKLYFHCLRCGTNYQDGTCQYIAQDAWITVPAKGHTYYKKEIKEVPSSCYQDGVKAHWQCTSCDKLFTSTRMTEETTLEELNIPAHHVVSNHLDEIVPQCATTGRAEAWYCNNCKNYFTDESMSEESKSTLAGLSIPATNLHQFDTNGYCNQCQGNEPAHWDDEKEEFLIANVGQLYWFANRCNTGEFADARLMNDITVNTNLLGDDGRFAATSTGLKTWTPIANYTHTFDGDGHAIRGLYCYISENTYAQSACMFYNLTPTGQVLNLTLADSYFNSYGGAAAFVSNAKQQSRIYNCHNKSHVVARYSDASGIAVGYPFVENCTNTGYVESSVYIAQGIGGEHIRNCANMGVVHATDHAAGITCNMRNSDAYIENCFNIGEVSDSRGSAYAIVCQRSSGALTNCYGLTTAQVPLGTTYDMRVCTLYAKTPEQFRIGEVCYLLNEENATESAVWRQSIFEDEVPTLDGPIVSYNAEKERYVNADSVKTIGIVAKMIKALQNDKFSLAELEALISTILER